MPLLIFSARVEIVETVCTVPEHAQPLDTRIPNRVVGDGIPVEGLVLTSAAPI